MCGCPTGTGAGLRGGSPQAFALSPVSTTPPLSFSIRIISLGQFLSSLCPSLSPVLSALRCLCGQWVFPACPSGSFSHLSESLSPLSWSLSWFPGLYLRFWGPGMGSPMKGSSGGTDLGASAWGEGLSQALGLGGGSGGYALGCPLQCVVPSQPSLGPSGTSADLSWVLGERNLVSQKGSHPVLLGGHRIPSPQAAGHHKHSSLPVSALPPSTPAPCTWPLLSPEPVPNEVSACQSPPPFLPLA